MAHAMSKADAAWLHMDRPTNLMVITSVMWFDRPLAPETLDDVVWERLVERFPRFRQVVREGRLFGGPRWVDDDAFDLRNHIHHVALPAPGDRAALQDLVSDVAGQPLDRSRPLWSMHLIDGYGEGSALLVRMHHCIADGIALARVMLSLTDGAAQLFADDPPDGRLALLGPLEPLVATARRTAGRALAVPATLAAGGARIVRRPRAAADDAATLARILLRPRDPESPFKGELHVPERVAWTAPFDLDTVKRTGRAHGATVNDVLVAAVAGGVRRYLVAHGADPADIHAIVPFNLRPLDQAVPTGLGNRFGLVNLPLPVAIADPIERLVAVQDAMGRIKSSAEGPLSYGVLELIGRTPVTLESRLVDLFTAQGTMVLTNVPGPRSTVTFAGVPVAGVLVWAPTSGSMSMSVSIFSYDGRVTVGFMTDAGLVPEPDELADAFRTELHALAAATDVAA